MIGSELPWHYCIIIRCVIVCFFKDMQLFNVALHQNSKRDSLRLGLTFQIENLSCRRVWKVDSWNIYIIKILQDLCTTVHKSCEILFLYYIFHKSTFQTLLQLSGFSIWKVNPSRKEPSLEFWCNVTLNSCMSIKKLVPLVTATEVLALVWNEMPQLICQFSVVSYQQFKIVMQKA